MSDLNFPIDSFLGDILKSVREHVVTIVAAPPGSGKTTRVPAYLMQKLPLDGKQIVLLQPRRIAVQSVAQRIASEVGSALGGQVGYAIRFESCVSRETQLLIATEGILRRKLTSDFALQNVAVVVFDEFHERSLDSDLLLAMCRQLQQTIRPDLRIVIMSATISIDDLQQQMPEAVVHQADGRTFPIDIKYTPSNSRDRLADAVATATMDALSRHTGDVLVFLPGKGEIFQTQAALTSRKIARDVEVLPLFGAMTMQQQSQAVSSSDRRRVILATNIAETSLTIEGIRVVIDSGLARVMRFDSTTGLDRLSLEPICRASADQRAGRAGRVAAGITYRLWSQPSQSARAEHLEPEILRVDFSSALLQLHLWNEPHINELPWLQQPTPQALTSAAELLQQLGAINANSVTQIGRDMGQLPLHPRLARLVIQSQILGCFDEACLAAALLSERDPFLRSTSNRSKPTTNATFRWSCDIHERIEAIAEYESTGNGQTKFGEIHRNSLEQIQRVAKQIASLSDDHSSSRAADVEFALRKAFLAAFPDRLAKRRDRGKDRGLMVGGRGVKLTSESGIAQSELFVCLDVDGAGTDAAVRKASAIERDWLGGTNLQMRDELFYAPSQATVQCRRRTYWIDLCIEESPAAVSDQQAAAEILYQAAIKDWQRCFPSDNKDLNNLLGRIALLCRHEPALQLPQEIAGLLHSVCKLICQHVRSLAEIKQANWQCHIVEMLSSEQSAALNRLTPSRVKIGSGREAMIDYSGAQPSLAIKIQEAFGMTENPKICNNRVVVQMHLLAPNQRPQQITNDLASFWKNGYPILKKELKRRYSKHAWPDDPVA